MEWKSYLNDRLIAEHKDGFFVIKPNKLEESMPIFCPVCEFIMRSSMDEDSYRKFSCCDSCSTTWAYPNKKKWSEGWRPSSDEVANKYRIDHT